MISTPLLRIVLVTSVLSFAIGCKSGVKTDEEAAAPMKLPVVKVEQRDVELNQDLVADIQAIQNVEIRARVDGFLTDIHVDEGKTVRKGQLLFTLADEEYEVAVSRARADLAGAQAESRAAEVKLEQVKNLVVNKVVSNTELRLAESNADAAKAKADAARSELDNSRIRLQFTHIKAPFTGVVDLLPLKRGSLIKEGTYLTTISDISSAFAYFPLTERQYLQFAKGKGSGDLRNGAVELILADGTQYPIKGAVETSQGEFQEETGTLSFRARFPNPDGLLKHGSTGRVRLSTKVEKAVIIPQKSCFELQDKTFVYLVTKDGSISTRSIKPASRYQDYYVVDEGLAPGDLVVYEGFQSLKEGDKIEPVITQHQRIAGR